LIVDADAQARAATEGALARGFEADSRVLSADAPQAGLDILQGLEDRTIGGLHTWLIRAGLATLEDIKT
jgi:hypothetical protein